MTKSSQSPIVIVEDDDFDVLLLKNTLATLVPGHPMVVCSTGAEATSVLGALLLNEIQPRVAFIDLKLPDVDGQTVIAWIRKRSELDSVPIIVVSGNDDPAVIRHVLESGADDYIQKPADATLIAGVLACTYAA